MSKTLFILSLFCLWSCNTNSQHTIKGTDAIYSYPTFTKDYERIEMLQSRSNLADVAKVFLDSPYVAKTLEIGNDSAPVINLFEFDCLTLVENSIALQKSNGDQQKFIDWIERIRYIKGEAQGYTSRLHYFSEWITDNISKHILNDVTCEIGGEPIQFSVDFMSTNPQYYLQLQKDSSLIIELQKIEQQINTRSYCYIPKDQLYKFESNIKDGDILGITTNIKGLDFTHNGLAIHQNRRLYMLHASSDYNKVMITNEPLTDYLESNKHMTGICVLRLK